MAKKKANNINKYFTRSASVTDLAEMEPKQQGFEEVKKLIVGLERSLTTKMEQQVAMMQSGFEALQGKFLSLESKVDTTSETVTELEKKNDALSMRVNQLETILRKNEWRDRKYNLLLYGVQEEKGENTFMVAKDIVRRSYGQDVPFSNVHRVRRREPRDTPDPIVIKFGSIPDRDAVLKTSRNLPGKMVLRTDLPQVLKQKRGRLAAQAYEIRKKHGWKTSIRESIDDVWITVKKDDDWRWQKFESGD